MRTLFRLICVNTRAPARGERLKLAKELTNARYDFGGGRHGVLRPRHRLRRRLRTVVRRTMTIDYLLGGGITLILLIYLVVALIRPERF